MRKQLEIPPEAAQAFVRDMRALESRGGLSSLLRHSLPRRREVERRNRGCMRITLFVFLLRFFHLSF